MSPVFPLLGVSYLPLVGLYLCVSQPGGVEISYLYISLSFSSQHTCLEYLNPALHSTLPLIVQCAPVIQPVWTSWPVCSAWFRPVASWSAENYSSVSNLHYQPEYLCLNFPATVFELCVCVQYSPIHTEQLMVCHWISYNIKALLKKLEFVQIPTNDQPVSDCTWHRFLCELWFMST